MRSLCSQAMYDCRAVYKQRWEEKVFQKETQTGLTFLFKAIRSLPKAMMIGMWSASLATKRCCQRQHISAHGELFGKAPMTVLYDPIWKKNLSRKGEDRANVPIQNPWVFIKDNDDWVGVISCRVSQGNPLFMEWRELSSNILKMGEARLHIASGNSALSQATKTVVRL